MIIGITGTIGAGKGTVTEYLVDNHNFTHLSVRNYLTEHLRIFGEEINRENMVNLANRLRRQYGAGYIVEQLFEQAQEVDGHCIIESIRSVGEVATLRSKGDFILLAIDAPIEMRYERVLNRKGKTDNLTFEKFKEEEEREFANTNPTEQNLSGCIALSDHLISNDRDIEALETQIEAFIQEEYQEAYLEIENLS